MVRMEGLEPSRIAPYASETYAYTKFRHIRMAPSVTGELSLF